MHSPLVQPPSASNFRAATHRDGIEWEELPSLAGVLAQRMAAIQHGTASGFTPSSGVPWATTLPAPLESAVQPSPFRETLDGLAMREVTEPEIFRLFFGAAPT